MVGELLFACDTKIRTTSKFCNKFKLIGCNNKKESMFYVAVTETANKSNPSFKDSVKFRIPLRC